MFLHRANQRLRLSSRATHAADVSLSLLQLRLVDDCSTPFVDGHNVISSAIIFTVPNSGAGFDSSR